MKIYVIFLVAVTQLSISIAEVTQSTNSYLTVADRIHAKKILTPGLKSSDTAVLYYSVLGYTLLGENLQNKNEICSSLIKAVKDVSFLTIENAFYVASTWKTIGSCQDDSISIVRKLLSSVFEEDTSTITDVYHAVRGLSALSEKLTRDKIDKITKKVQTTLRKDSHPWNLAYTFHIAADLDTAGTFAFDHIEDAIIQADEVGGKFLQFEGGLSVTSLLVNGIFRLSQTLKKKWPLTSVQKVKIANYLLSRRSVQTPNGITNLLSSLTILANDEFDKPIYVALADEGVSLSNTQPLVTVKVCDILGKALPNEPKVVANSANKVGDDTAILSKKTLQPSSTDRTLFTMNFMAIKPEHGLYKMSITAGSVTNTVVVKVLCEVTVENLEIGTGDADQTTQPKLTRVIYPSKLSHKVEADSQQKLVMRFLLRDAATKVAMRTHQAFVRLSSASETDDDTDKRGHEIIFVAEPDTSHLYKFDMPVGTAAVNFGYQSGDYNIELIIGDAVLSNPFKWTVATVSLKFPDNVAAAGERTEKSSYKERLNVYTTKPEIKHMFREPEKRPPVFVSNLFTGLCLAPVLLLLILWAKLGVNISNFPLSISAITFHLGLGSIFLLFGIFWLKLNMFVTLRYLLGLGVVTFLAGNKLLSRIAHKHKSR